MKNAAKDFSPIADDYAFFMAHATEAENDLRNYAAHLVGFNPRGVPLRMLDFGCGAGDFTERFLRHAAWPPGHWTLTLVDPAERLRCQAAERLQQFTSAAIEHAAELSSDAGEGFDLILANHVLYYVSDLEATLAGLLAALHPGGLLLGAIAGRDNALFPFWERGFAALGEPVPYQLAEDVEAVLRKLGVDYHSQPSQYELVFPDSEENRLKILRFLCGDHLARMPVGKLLAQFDPLAHDGSVVIRTHSRHFVVRGA